MDTFKGLPVIRKTTADKINNGRVSIHIFVGMEPESSWGWLEHTQWVAELTGLDAVQLVLLVGSGYGLLTDEWVSEVWLLSADRYNTTARLIHQDD